MAGERQITTVKNIAGSYAPSPMQRALIFHSLFAPHSGADIEQFLCTLPEELNDAAFWQTWEGKTDFPRDKRVHELFETQVERTPNAVALVYTKGEVSYRELDNQANRVAIHLRSLGVGPDVPVGICAQRSKELRH